MSSKIWRRTLPVVLAGLLALLPVASFAGVLGWDTEPQQRDHGRPMSVLTRAWETILGIWEMAGAGLDPHGNPGQGSGSTDSNGVTGTGDAGAGLDPHG